MKLELRKSVYVRKPPVVRVSSHHKFRKAGVLGEPCHAASCSRGTKWNGSGLPLGLSVSANTAKGRDIAKRLQDTCYQDVAKHSDAKAFRTQGLHVPKQRK